MTRHFISGRESPLASASRRQTVHRQKSSHAVSWGSRIDLHRKGRRLIIPRRGHIGPNTQQTRSDSATRQRTVYSPSPLASLGCSPVRTKLWPSASTTRPRVHRGRQHWPCSHAELYSPRARPEPTVMTRTTTAFFFPAEVLPTDEVSCHRHGKRGARSGSRTKTRRSRGKQTSRQGVDGCRSVLGLVPPTRLKLSFRQKPSRAREGGPEELRS